MGYYVGDIPAQDLVIEPVRREESISLAPFDEVAVALYDPAGVLVDGPGFLGTIGDEVIVVEWPGITPFEIAGIYSLRLTLTSSTTDARERVPAVRLVADIDDGWHTLESARDDWRDAPGYDSWLYELLWSARQQVVAYGPKLAEGAHPPLNYLRAQLMQARNLWNAGKVDPASGGQGEDTFVMRPFPLDWMIKQIIRPVTARPVIG